MLAMVSEVERAQLDAALTQCVAIHALRDVRAQTALVEDVNVAAAILSQVDQVRTAGAQRHGEPKPAPVSQRSTSSRCRRSVRPAVG